MSKRLGSRYRSGRSPDWLKFKNPDAPAVKREAEEDWERMKSNQGAQFEISIDGVPRTYRDRQDIALQTARFLKSRNPHSVVKIRGIQSGEETVVAFKSEQ